MVLLPRSLHPAYRDVVQAIVEKQGVELVELALDADGGYTNPKVLDAHSGQDVAVI